MTHAIPLFQRGDVVLFDNRYHAVLRSNSELTKLQPVLARGTGTNREYVRIGRPYRVSTEQLEKDGRAEYRPRPR